MNQAKKIWSGYGCYIAYTVAFIPVVLFMDGLFRDAGNNFIINHTDGVTQHFNSMLYVWRYIRSAIKEGVFPLMNYTIGQGSDIVLTLNGYDFFNPICILSVLLFHKNMFFAFEFMILFNVYLAGIAFCVYCRTVGRTNAWTLASGGMIYAFCGYVMHYGVEAPIFMSGVILLPLLLASMELYIRKQRALPLIITVFVSIMSNYYTFFMNVIFFAVYLLIRYFPCAKNEIKDRVIAIVKLAGVTITGGLLSAVWLLPAAFGTVANNGGYQTALGYSDSLIFYPPDVYFKMVEYFTNSAKSPDKWTYMGFFPISMIALWVLFMSHRRSLNRTRIAVLGGFIGIGIPLVGLAINGFRYANNRWTYAFSLAVAFAFVEVSDDLANITFKQTAVVVAGIVGLVMIWFNDSSYDQYQYVPLLLLIMSGAIVFICGRPYIPNKIVPCVMLVLTVFSAIANITVQYGRGYEGMVGWYCDAAEGYGIFMKYSSARVADSANDDEFYRIEMQEERPNTEGYNNVHGTTYYFSAVDGNMEQYYSDLQLTTCREPHLLHGLSGCRALMDIASVKYYTLPSEEEKAYVPFGYRETADCVYENEYYLPAAYLQKNYIRYEDFRQLNPADMQQAMLQGAVLEDTPGLVGAVAPVPRSREIEYAMESDNVSWADNWVSASEDGGTLTFSFEPQPDCELYVWLEGMQLDRRMTKKDIKAYGGFMTEDGFKDAITKGVTMTSPKYQYHVERQGVLFNLGYNEEGYDTVVLDFEGVCNYWCDGIHILAVPMGSSYINDVEPLRSAACNDIKIGNDRIYGTVTSDGDSLLQLTVPYSIGWKAYIDGKKADVLKSNLMYTAVEIPAGSHEIKMKYCTPFLKAGFVISFVTLAGMIAVFILKKKGKLPQ